MSKTIKRRVHRIRKTSNNKKKILIAVTAIALAIGCASVGCFIYLNRAQIIGKAGNQKSPDGTSNGTGEQNYISETAFDGSEEVDERLFTYPYPSESEGYISNKKLYEQLGSNKMELMSSRADEIGSRLYSFDYRTVRTDYDTSFKNLSSLFREVAYEDGTDQNVVLSEMIEDFSDAQLQMTSDYKTSKFMVYQNGMSTYVRGILTVYVWNCSDIDKASKYFPSKLKIGEDNVFVYEIEILNSMDSLMAKDMQIFDYYDCRFLDIL